MRPPQGGQNRFPRAARILTRADFARVLRTGRRLSSGPFVLHVARGEGEAVRLGLTVGRRIGGAVLRNRVKRLLREHFRQQRSVFPPGTDVVAVATGVLGGVMGAALGRAIAEAVRAAAAAAAAGGTRRAPPQTPAR